MAIEVGDVPIVRNGKMSAKYTSHVYTLENVYVAVQGLL